MIRFLLAVVLAASLVWVVGRELWRLDFALRLMAGLWAPVLLALAFGFFAWILRVPE